MKSLKKVLMAVLLVCGMVCGLNANAAASDVDHSSKEALLASFVKAAMLNDVEAGWECISENIKKELKERNKSKEWFIAGWFRDILDHKVGEMMRGIHCTQIDGKWYVDEM